MKPSANAKFRSTYVRVGGRRNSSPVQRRNTVGEKRLARITHARWTSSRFVIVNVQCCVAPANPRPVRRGRRYLRYLVRLSRIRVARPTYRPKSLPDVRRPNEQHYERDGGRFVPPSRNRFEAKFTKRKRSVLPSYSKAPIRFVDSTRLRRYSDDQICVWCSTDGPPKTSGLVLRR